MSRDEIFGRLIIINRYFLYFFFLVDEKIKLEVLVLKLLTNFEHPSSNPLQRPLSGDSKKILPEGSRYAFSKFVRISKK